MIPIFSNIRQNKEIAKELNSVIKEVIKRGIYILGPKVAQFEEAFAKYLGVKYAIGVACGTDALSISLLSVGVGRGDEVIIPANSYPTAFAVTAIDAIPKLVDIDPETYNIDPKKIPQAITKKTKAIIAVHLYGQPADLFAIRRYVDMSEKKIALIEDCAQAHGAMIKIKNTYQKLKIDKQRKRKTLRHLGGGRHSQTWLGRSTSRMVYPVRNSSEVEESEGGLRKVGGIGDVGCFSFYPTKNLGCFGDGGMVVTNSEETAKKIRLLRMYGEEKRYKSVILGRNSRLDELQAAILLVKLKYLNKWNERRREIAKEYLSLCGSCCLGISDSFTVGGAPSTSLRTGMASTSFQPVTPEVVLRLSIKLPYEASYTKHVYHLFVIKTKKRDELKTYLEKHQIQTAIHYPTPIHLQPSFKYLGHKEGDFPQSEEACREILSLPMFPELTEKEIGTIVEAIGRFFYR